MMLSVMELLAVIFSNEKRKWSLALAAISLLPSKSTDGAWPSNKFNRKGFGVTEFASNLVVDRRRKSAVIDYQHWMINKTQGCKKSAGFTVELTVSYSHRGNYQGNLRIGFPTVGNQRRGYGEVIPP